MAALVFAVSVLSSRTPAFAPAPPTPVVVSSTSTTAAWIVSGFLISAASIIACAIIIGAEEGREMTAEEALLSGLVPLGCMLRKEFGFDPRP